MSAMSTIKIPNDIWNMIIDFASNESIKHKWMNCNDKFYNLDHVICYEFNENNDLIITFNIGHDIRKFKVTNEERTKVCKYLSIENK